MPYKKVIFNNANNVPYADLVDLLHKSFKERLDANMNFGCATYNSEELKKHTSRGYIVTYYDGDRPIAMGTLSIKRKYGMKCGFFENFAVSPEEEYRRKGLGGKVIEHCIKIANDIDCSVVLSCTAIGAESSVKCHLKNGFRIYRVKHYKGRKYISFNFYYPLKKDVLNMFLSVFGKPIFLVSKLWYINLKSIYFKFI